MGSPRATKLAAGDPPDSSLSAAAPAAGGRGIDGSRRVYSLGVRGVLAGGVVEVAAWPEWLLSVTVPSSASGAPVEALGGSGAFCSPESQRASPRATVRDGGGGSWLGGPPSSAAAGGCAFG